MIYKNFFQIAITSLMLLVPHLSNAFLITNDPLYATYDYDDDIAPGPDVVVINLDDSKSKKIESLIHGLSDRPCIDDSVIYVDKNERPAKITDDLAYQAFIKNKPEAIVKLSQILIDYRGSEDGFKRNFGLDGIVVYTSRPKPRFMSLTTPRTYKHKIKTFYVKNSNDEKELLTTFCKAKPPITHLPLLLK